MNILNNKILIEKLVLDDKIYISLSSGDVLAIPCVLTIEFTKN